MLFLPCAASQPDLQALPLQQLQQAAAQLQRVGGLAGPGAAETAAAAAAAVAAAAAAGGAPGSSDVSCEALYMHIVRLDCGRPSHFCCMHATGCKTRTLPMLL